MNSNDWRRFLGGRFSVPIAIAQLSSELTAHLGASSDKVYIRQDYARKSVLRHNLNVDHFPLIFETIDYGVAIDDRPLHLTFFREEPGVGWFQVTIKRGGEERLLYIATFYRRKASQVMRNLAAFPIVRAAKHEGRP